ncbi:MAG: secretin N-terminal domain-containing protein [Fimbriimonadaceae bacterium]
MFLAAFAAVALATAPSLALAQFDFGGGFSEPARPAWEQFELNPNTRLRLDFRNANVDNVLAIFQRASGITIVKDPALSGPITLTSAAPVSLNEAFSILNAALNLRNFDMRREGNLLVIRQRQQRNQGGRPGGDFGGFDPSMFAQMMPQPTLRVYPLQYANATQVARVLNEVFAQSGQSQMDQLIAQFGQMAQQRFGGQQGRGGFGGRFGGAMGRPGGTSVVRASADDFSNSVIVNAPEREQGQVRELIRQLDKETDLPQRARVYRLQYALADEVAPIVQNVLVSNAPRGRGGLGSTNIPPEQRFQQAIRLGGFQAAFGTVVADNRTNSLVVTATEENHALVADVLKEIDTEVQLETSTFVFPLENARADQMASLLNSAFGTRSGMGGQGTFNRGTNPGGTFNRTNNQNRNTGFGGAGGGTRPGTGFGRGVDDVNNLNLQLADPDAEEGELATRVTVDQTDLFAQFFQGGAGGAFRQGAQARPGAQAGRDAEGRVVNVRDLTGQVTTIPDPNTNSIIVVTTPDNAELIRGILAQLDRLPEQVLIETIIVEATLDASTKLGVEWAYNRAQFQDGQTGTIGTDFNQRRATPPLTGLRYSLTGGTLDGFLNALATDSKFQVLSTPRIFTSNNVQAQINISQSVPFILSTREDPNGGITFNYSFQDVGIVLTVTPRITANGTVTMDVSQTANDLQGFTDFNAPIVNQRQANTTVSVRDGETIILGGIIRNTVNSTTNKIPLLGDIPILGNLFKSTSNTRAKTELLVFLTPRIVRTPEDAQKLRDQQTQQMSPSSRRELGNATTNPGALSNGSGAPAAPSNPVPNPDPAAVPPNGVNPR